MDTLDGYENMAREKHRKYKATLISGSQWRDSGIFTVNFEQILQMFLVFSLLTLNMQISAWNWYKIHYFLVS